MLGKALPTVVLVALAGLAPLAQAADGPTTDSLAATPTTLYFHLLGVEDFRINTQAPPEDWSAYVQYGSTTSTLTCVSPVAGNTAGFANEYHTYYGVPLPGLVDYGNVQNGVPRVAPQRGLAGDVQIDPETAVRLVWYVAVPEGTPTPVPNFVLRATLRSGDAISIDDEAYNQGAVVLLGESAPSTLAGPLALGLDGQPSPHVKSLGQVDGHWLYEVGLDLERPGALLAGAAGFNLRIDLFVDNPLCADPGGQGYAMPNLVAMATLPSHRPRLELAVRPALDAFMRTELQAGHLILLASAGSVWGAYDVDDRSATLLVDGPAASGFIPIEVEEAGYGGPDAPARKVLAWLWPDAVDAPPGRYAVQLTVPNLQGTAAATATTEVVLGEQADAPGPALPMLGLGLLALALAARRSR